MGILCSDVGLPPLVLACLGFLSPANRGALMTCSVVLWVLLGTPAGYVSARLYKSKPRLHTHTHISVPQLNEQNEIRVLERYDINAKPDRCHYRTMTFHPTIELDMYL